jgi:hypothetical protein
MNENKFIIWNYFNMPNLKEIMDEKRINNKSKIFKNILNKNNFTNKKSVIENLEYLSNIYFIDYEYYNDNTINKYYKNRIVNNKLIEMIYDYENFKKKNITTFDKLKYINNKVYEKNIEQSIQNFKTTVENNITIFNFMNSK